MNLCQYKNAFGIPNQGIHKLRDPIFNTAVADVLMTFAASYLISWTFNYNFLNVLAILFILSVILHYIFCVETTVSNYIFTR